MKSDTIIVLAAVAAGGYLLYRSTSGIFGQISAAGQGATERITETYEAVTPVYVERQVLQEEQKLLKQAGSTARTEIAQDVKTTRATITGESKITALKQAQPEDTQRYIEYGTTVGEYIKKIFIPTVEVASQRRQAISNIFKSATKKLLFPKKIIGTAVKIATSPLGLLNPFTTYKLFKV